MIARAPYASACVCSDGSAAAVALPGGYIEVYNSGGRRTLRRHITGAEYVTIADGGRKLAVSGRSGRSYWVQFLNSEGENIYRFSVQGKLLGLAISPGGDSAFASTSGRRMYVFDISRSPRWRRVQTDQDLLSLQYAEAADALLAQTVSPRGLAMVDPTGRSRWWKPRPAGMVSVESCAEGTRVLTISSVISPRPQIGISVYTSAGLKLLAKTLEGYEPRAAVSRDGALVGISYRRKLTHGNRSVMERRLGLWEVRGGKRRWEFGGLFFKPVLMGMLESPSGLVVAEEYALLSGVDVKGKLAWRGPTLGAKMLELKADDSWRLGWARFGDGRLELWNLGQRSGQAALGNVP